MHLSACTYFGLRNRVFLPLSVIHMTRGSVDSIAIAYGLDDRGVEVRVPVGLRIFTSSYRPGRL
jgi:hypothetical protein